MTTSRPARVSRRTVLQGAAAAAGAALLVRPGGALAAPLGPRDAYGTSRASRLFPGTWVAHADLHNHSLLSDGAGDPANAFADMRSNGLDVAALTDHSTLGKLLPGPAGEFASPCDPFPSPDEGDRHPCQQVLGLDERGWSRTGELADEADEPGRFTALRGFEWSSPTLGHMNVWFSDGWADPLTTGGIGSVEDLLGFAEQEGIPIVGDVLGALADLVAQTPIAGLGMAGWYAWLKRDPSTPVVGGGADALVGFNHPGREPFRFSDFAFDGDLLDRVVSLEIMNRREDYLFRVAHGTSPLVGCLDAGWKPGLLGVTDQHATVWGVEEGLGRGGYYVDELSRDGMRAAMLERRFFATNLQGLRLDAAANGVRMGRTLGHRDGRVRIEIDVDRGAAWIGHELSAQLLTTGRPLPTVLAAETFRVPGSDEPLPTLTVDLDVADVPWLVLRLSDPAVEADGRADDVYAAFGAAVAYASPWYLDPDAPLPVIPDDEDLPAETPTPPEPDQPRVDTPAGEVARQPAGSPGRRPSGAGVPDRGPLPVTGGGPGGPGALLLGAAAGLLALRRRRDHDVAHGHGDHDHHEHGEPDPGRGSPTGG